MEIEFGLAGSIGSGFDYGVQLDFFLPFGQHVFIDCLQALRCGFAANGRVIFNDAQSVLGFDISSNDFAGQATSDVDDGHGS